MNLRSALESFDGKTTSTLEAIADRASREGDTILQLCEITVDSEPRIQVGATWLLKRFAEEGLDFSTAQAAEVLELLEGVRQWEASLHVLQLLPFLEIPQARAAVLSSRLTELVSHENKFVRAWAYNGLVVLADQHQVFREEVTKQIRGVASTEAASVKARIRNAEKACPWLKGNP